MATFNRRAAMALAVAAVLAGCDTTRSKSTTDLSPDDLDFVSNAYNIIEFDRDECSLAVNQSQSPEVRALAARFLQQANDFNARLAPIAAAAGVRPPTVLRKDLRIRAGRLRLNQGLDFDRIFIEDQIVSHQDAINMQENMMETAGGNADLKELSKAGTGILRANLEKLHELQKSMMLTPSRRGVLAR